MEIVNRQLIIRPIVRNRFSGKSAYDKTVTVIQGAQLSSTGLYKTGLTSQEERDFENEMGLAKGTLNRQNSSFWGDLDIRLNNSKLTILNILTPLDDLKYRVLLEHDLIANTEHDVEKNPGAKFYIYDPEAASKIENSKIDCEFEAVERFTNLSLEERKGLLRVYGKRGVDNLSETMVKTELYKFVKKDPKEFIRLSSSKTTPIRALLEALIEKNIIVKKGTYFYNGEDLIGGSTDEAVAYLSNPKNQAIKLSLEGTLKHRSK